jgi:hypothetical protein
MGEELHKKYANQVCDIISKDREGIAELNTDKEKTNGESSVDRDYSHWAH